MELRKQVTDANERVNRLVEEITKRLESLETPKRANRASILDGMSSPEESHERTEKILNVLEGGNEQSIKIPSIEESRAKTMEIEKTLNSKENPYLLLDTEDFLVLYEECNEDIKRIEAYKRLVSADTQLIYAARESQAAREEGLKETNRLLEKRAEAQRGDAGQTMLLVSSSADNAGDSGDSSELTSQNVGRALARGVP